MKDILVKTLRLRLLIIDVDGVLTDDSLELFSRIQVIINSSNDANG